MERRIVNLVFLTAAFGISLSLISVAYTLIVEARKEQQRDHVWIEDPEYVVAMPLWMFNRVTECQGPDGSECDAITAEDWIDRTLEAEERWRHE